MSYGFKLTIGTTDIVDDEALTIENVRPENNISSLNFTINDYKSRSYASLVDTFTAVELSIRQGSGGYTKTFAGTIVDVRPGLTSQGEVLEVAAWGNEHALTQTRCNTSFGKESQHNTIVTPQDIIVDILDNYVEKSLDGAVTNWTITDTKVEDVHADFTVTNLTSEYLDNFTLISRLFDLITSHSVLNAQVSSHWYVNPSNQMYVKNIQSDSSDAAWTRYYGGSQALATIIVDGETVVSRGFQKNINDYAQRILLASAFRKPAFDSWTEDSTVTWGTSNAHAHIAAGVTPKVGSNCLELEDTLGAPGHAYIWYPSGGAAAWDLDKTGSPNNVPHLNFYMQTEDTGVWTVLGIYLFTDHTILGGGHGDSYFVCQPYALMEPIEDEWIKFSIPVGTYWGYDPALQKHDGATNFNWGIVNTAGDPSWSDINGVMFHMDTPNNSVYFDDLYFSGKIIRDCYDATYITATRKERQKLLRLDTALDDTLVATDGTGTAGLLAYAELLRCLQQPVMGTVTMPLTETLLPGQTLHIHSGDISGSGLWRFDSDMRIKELTHTISNSGCNTTVTLTDDVANSLSQDLPSLWGLLMEHAGAMNQAEAGDMKASGIDNLVPRLSWDPT